MIKKFWISFPENSPGMEKDKLQKDEKKS